MDINAVVTYTYSIYPRMQGKEKIAGMDMHVGHSTTMKFMRAKEIMFVVQLGALIWHSMYQLQLTLENIFYF